MNYIEYGKDNKDVIILLHGGGLSWWNYREVADILSSDYHVILPILDGHTNSKNDFISIEENATRIIDFIIKQFNGSVLLIGGLSLGGQIALEILSKKKDICRYALIESALIIPSKFTFTLIKPMFECCYGLIKQKWFSKLQFKSLKIKPSLFEDYFKDTCGISKKNMIAFLQANTLYSIKPSIADCFAKVHVFVGEKESRVMRKSANMIDDVLLDSTLHILPNLYHGEFSINHAKNYVVTVHKIINNG